MRQGGREAGRSAGGQVLVEVLLILPIFLFLIFTIMEIGHLAFRTILLHHAAYEVARIGSLTAGYTPAAGCDTPRPNFGKMAGIAAKILPNARLSPSSAAPVFTLVDDQEKCPNYDVVVDLQESVRMIFPMTGFVLANEGRSMRRLRAQVRMPIERPLFK